MSAIVIPMPARKSAAIDADPAHIAAGKRDHGRPILGWAIDKTTGRPAMRWRVEMPMRESRGEAAT